MDGFIEQAESTIAPELALAWERNRVLEESVERAKTRLLALLPALDSTMRHQIEAVVLDDLYI